MSVAARKIEVEHMVNERTALDEKVDHIQSDVAELKGDVKRIDASLAEHRVETEKSFGKVREEISALRNDVTKEIGSLRADITNEVGALRTDITKEIGALRTDVTKEIGSIRVEIKDAMAEIRRERVIFIGWTVGAIIAAVGAFSTFLAPQAQQPAREVPPQENVDASPANPPR
jgi:chromosome segregation ATPase